MARPRRRTQEDREGDRARSTALRQRVEALMEQRANARRESTLVLELLLEVLDRQDERLTLLERASQR